MKESKFSKKKASKIHAKHHAKAHDVCHTAKKAKQEMQQATPLHPNAKNLNK